MHNIQVQDMNGEIIDNELSTLGVDVVLMVIDEIGKGRTYDCDLFFTDDDTIREINHKQRKIDRATDVLSFPQFENEPNEFDVNLETGNIYLGEIVISLETAKTQAENLNQTFEREVAFLVLHGMLHLFGFDHIDKDEETMMLEMQRYLIEKVEKLIFVEEDEIEDTIDVARKAMVNAHVPYSGFRVGACLVTEDNKMYSGVNIEISSFGATICAERTSIFKAISEGERIIKFMVITSSQKEFVYPCGICRQVMADFFKPYTKIVVTNIEDDYIIYRIRDILPKAFTKFDGGKNEF